MNSDCHPEERRGYYANKPAWPLTQRQETGAGIILDLSPFGGRLLLPRGSHLVNDRLLLIVSDDRIDNRIRLNARILWRNQSHTGQHIEIGCEFLRPSNQSKLALMQLIRANQHNQRQLIVKYEML